MHVEFIVFLCNGDIRRAPRQDKFWQDLMLCAYTCRHRIVSHLRYTCTPEKCLHVTGKALGTRRDSIQALY